MSSASGFGLEAGFTPSTALATVEMQRDYSPGAPALIIEGPDDLRLFKKLTRDECIVVVAGSRNGVIAAVNEANEKGMALVLGVIDRDYSDFRGEALPENVVMTDQNDVEVMLILSNALSGLVLESLGDRVLVLQIEGKQTPLATFVVTAVSVLGQLRLLKHEKLPGLNFSGLRLRNHLQSDGLTINQESLRADIERRSSGLATAEELEALQMEIEGRRLPVEMLACGHDAVQFLCIAIESGALGTPLRVLNERECAALLRSSYQPGEFVGSEIGRAIQEWCEEQGVQILVANE